MTLVIGITMKTETLSIPVQGLVFNWPQQMRKITQYNSILQHVQ